MYAKLECGCVPNVTLCPAMKQVLQKIRSAYCLSEWREYNRWIEARVQHLNLPEEARYSWQ